jgi:uncharacterized protein (DUF885 family)
VSTPTALPTMAELVPDFLEESFRLDPLVATNAGNHDHDDAWPDWSPTGDAHRLASGCRWRERLAGLPADRLSPDDAIDRDRLDLLLDDDRFAIEDLREDTWDPQVWGYRLGDGLFTLLAREFAPPAVRIESFSGRLEGIPDVLAAAKAALGSGPEPVSRFHTDIALLHFDGVGALISEGIQLADSHASDTAVAALRPRLDAAVEAAGTTMDDFRHHLRRVVLPKAEGEGRLGRERFDAKLARTFSDPAITSDSVLAEAESQFEVVRAEMVEIARELWPAWRAGEPLPAEDAAIVKGVLDAIARDHPPTDALLDVCREELGRIEAFCREQSVIGLAEEPLQIQWTPRFLRPFAGAMLHSPGPFDLGQKAFFSITPPAEDWSPERVESMLREHHRRQLTLLTIHEAVPGHYLQGVYANRVSRPVRSVFGDGVFAEGWAVYITDVMLKLGLDGDDLALRLADRKYFLRAVVNAIIDVRIHAHGMTQDEAISLMVDGAFQEESEARSKYDRARLSSTQLSTYFIGSRRIADLEAEARRRAGEAFDYRTYLESVISQGSLPIPLLRRALFETAAGG